MTTSPRPRVGILKCGHVADRIVAQHGDYIAWFHNLLEGQGFDMPVWSVVDMDFPDSITECDGWLLTGSPLGAYEDHAFIPQLESFIRVAHAVGKPLVGICFGHQVIAKALGGRVEKFPGGIKIGRQTYAIDGLGAISLNAWHNDQVIEAPNGAEIIARGPDCAIGGMRIGPSMLTLQTHPELTSACLLDLIDMRRDTGTFAPGQIETAVADAALPTDAGRTADWLGAFFRDAIARAAA